MTNFIDYTRQFQFHPAETYNYFGILDDVPENIFYIGDLGLLNTIKAGIIGSRLPSSDALKITQNIACELSTSGFTIVSGLARGIDSCAHKYSIPTTIAVLAHGLQEVYPRENYEIASNIANKGLVITEYAYGTGIAKYRFVARNRLIAALSKFLIVIQVGENSGSLITAGEAIKLGIPIFVWIPQSGAGEGEKMLLSWGAKPFQTINHLIANLRF